MHHPTHCELVTPHGDIDLGQHWFRYCLVVWGHRAITCINVDQSLVRIWRIRLKAISQRVPTVLFGEMKIILLLILPHLPQANMLIIWYIYTMWNIRCSPTLWSHPSSAVVLLYSNGAIFFFKWYLATSNFKHIKHVGMYVHVFHVFKNWFG